MKKISVYMMMIISIISCSETSVKNYNAEILNAKLVEAIDLYINDNKIDFTTKIITLTPSDGGSFIISNENSDLFKSNQLPTYYTVLDDCKIIFIYSDKDSNFNLASKAKLLIELQDIIKKCEVNLKPYKLGLSYNPPVWKVWSCDGNLRIDDFTQSYELEELPCG